MKREIEFDLIVVGGGPAGMMCAGRAAERGARVLLLEKNGMVGKKLSITGGGRCNLTNAIAETRELVSRYGKGGKALFPSFSRFGPNEAIQFFHGLGLFTKLEAEGRVFPVSEDANDVVRALAAYMNKGRVKVVLNAAVKQISAADREVRIISSVGEFFSHEAAIATGGTAYPETGSTGEGFDWLRRLGHQVVADDASLVPVAIKETWVAELSGLAFPAARLVVWQNGKKLHAKTGKLLFTHFGLSGPLVLNLSKAIGEARKNGEVEVTVDLLPKTALSELDKQALAVFAVHQNKKIKNVIGHVFPAGIGETALAQCGLDGEKFVNLISRDERLRLLKFAKEMRLGVRGLLGLDKAIVSSGGVQPAEVDMRTMRSKINPNIFIIGDALNFNRPSGGYSLQICWTTGRLAGEAAKIYAPPRP